MEQYNILPLLETLKAKPDIFICGPSYGETKLRVYAYGGILCRLPTTAPATIDLLSEDYLQKDSPLSMTLNGLKGNEEKEKFLREHLDDLLSYMQKRFTSKSGDYEERSQQTAISRVHTSFRQNGTVVCDFQSSIPKACLPDGIGRPTFDMVTFSIDEAGNGSFTLVELKCGGKACRGSNGLEKHARDMLKCVQSPSTSEAYKKELLRRLGYMRKYDLLQNCPAELERLSPRHLEQISLRAAFLFTSGPDLDRDKAVSLCQEFIPENNLSQFVYCFAGSSQMVDLSSMKSWEAFRQQV